MKASLILATLVILSSLSMRAQEVEAPDFLANNVKSINNDPLANTRTLSADQTETVLWKAVDQEKKDHRIASKSKVLLLAASDAVGAPADTKNEYTVSELDYSNFQETNEYKYFLKEGGLKFSF